MSRPLGDHPEAALMRAKGGLRAREKRAGASREPAQPIVVKDRNRLQAIPVEKLDYVEAQGDYVALYCAGRRYLKLQPISCLEGSLDRARFVRVHRSRIVNLERIARVSPPARECALTLADGTRLGMSRVGYARLLDAMDRAASALEPDSPAASASATASATAD